MELRLYDVDKTTAKLIICSLSTVQPTFTCSGGSVSVGTIDDRYNTGGKSVTTTLVTITGLAAWSDYTYTAVQGSDSISGGFKTLPAGQDTDFGFIVGTCEHWSQQVVSQVYTTIKNLMQSAEEPITTMFHIDDIMYADQLQVLDSEEGINGTGIPEQTKVATDYVAAWGAYYGLLNTKTKKRMRHADRMWVFRNLSCCASGGDHAIEGNHCRGSSTNGVPNTDYRGCDKTLEALCMAEWNAFIGDANPPLLRAGKAHWGKTIGPVKFALYDYSLYSVPHDSVLNPDAIGYGAEQIADIDTYMDVDTEPFKCFLHESPVIVYGQPYRGWHATEADALKASYDASNNLNGVGGNSFAVFGDNHSPHVMSLDTFWGFCAGVLQDSQAVNAGMDSEAHITAYAPWGGRTRWSKHAHVTTGDSIVGGFWYFRVLASQTPKKIEAVFIEGGTGKDLSPKFTLTQGATDNQWTMTRGKLA